MKYLVTFIWALILTQMVNFVLNSLNGGGSLDVIKPLLLQSSLPLLLPF